MRSREVSIRVRLTLWYSTVLACGLLLFAGSIWLLLKQSLYRDLRAELADRSQSLTLFVKGELSEPAGHLVEELEEYSRGLPVGTYFAFSDGRGRKLFASKKDLVSPGGHAVPHEHYLVKEEALSVAAHRYRIQTAISTEQAESLLHELRVLLLTLTPAVIALASLGGFLLSRQALKPVLEITNAARTLSINDLSQRLRVPQTGDEVQYLSETWNSMLDRLADAVGRLSRFTQDASHELRTPLAIIRSTAEIASRRPRSEQDYVTAFQQIMAESDRLTLLVQDLLLLARGDSLLEPEMKPLCLGNLAHDVCDELRSIAAAKNISVVEEITRAQCALVGNSALLRRLLIVLIDNAINYSRPPGIVEVRMHTANSKVLVEVADHGIGISQSDLPRVFDRFFRSDAARQAWHDGAGLGLSLAATIARQHGAEIHVRSTPGIGSTFTVSFPVI